MSLSGALAKAANGIFNITKILTSDINQLSTDETVASFSVLDIFEKKLLKDRKAKLRKKILNLIEVNGALDERGHKVLRCPDIGADAKREVRGGRVKLNVGEAERFVHGYSGGDREFVQRLIDYVPKVNEEVLASLLEDNTMPRDVFDRIVEVGKPTEVLKVTPPRELLDMIEGV